MLKRRLDQKKRLVTVDRLHGSGALRFRSKETRMFQALAFVRLVVAWHADEKLDFTFNPFSEDSMNPVCYEGINSKTADFWMELGMKCQNVRMQIGTAYGDSKLWIGAADGTWMGATIDFLGLQVIFLLASVGIYKMMVAVFERFSSFVWRLSHPVKKREFTIQTRKRLSGCVQRANRAQRLKFRSLTFAILFLSVRGTNGMDAEQFQQFMGTFGNFVQQQTDALQATAQSVQQSVASSIPVASSSSVLNRNFESAAKILKSPECFDSGDSVNWLTWRHTFLDWISCANSRFVDLLKDVENLGPENPIEMSGQTSANVEMSKKLYVVLTSYLRGPALQLSRLLGED